MARKQLTLDYLNSLLDRSAKTLDRCAGLIRDIEDFPSSNIRHIGEALASVFEIHRDIYQQRPDLTPEFLKAEPVGDVYRRWSYHRDHPELRVEIESGNRKARRLRELIDAPEILIMPGAWDALSALLFEQLGFEAIQGSSSAIAASFGYPDGEASGRGATLWATSRMSAAVSVPVNADGERGYGGPHETALTVLHLARGGAAGMNLEDSAGSGKDRLLVPIPEQLEKIAAVMEAKRALDSEFFLNGRVDALAIMASDPKAALEEAIRRGNAYAEAGADCIFYLNPGQRETISRLVKEVRAPVSVLAVADTPSVPELQELGVARVSYGSAFQRVTLAALRRFATEISGADGHAAISSGMTGREMAELLRTPAS